MCRGDIHEDIDDDGEKGGGGILDDNYIGEAHQRKCDLLQFFDVESLIDGIEG